MNDAPAPRRVAALELAWRIAWIVVRLVLVFWLARPGDYFFYQGF